MPEPPSGNALRDYRISQVEEAVIELKNHTRKLEDNFLEMRSQNQADKASAGVSYKQLVSILVAMLIAFGTVGYYLLTIIK